MKKLLCKIFGHPLVDITMASIYKMALNKESLGAYKCQRCDQEIK